MSAAGSAFPGLESDEQHTHQSERLPPPFIQHLGATRCGDAIYTLQHLLQVLKVMRGEHLPIPDQFTAELRDLAKQLLNKNPKARPTPEQCLKAPFLRVRLLPRAKVWALMSEQGFDAPLSWWRDMMLRLAVAI